MAYRPDPGFLYSSEQYSGFIDYFAENNTNDEPAILGDGTSVLFPRGWTDEDADKWRKGIQLQSPNGLGGIAQKLFH